MGREGKPVPVNTCMHAMQADRRMLIARDPQPVHYPAPSPQHCTACMVWLPRCGMPAGPAAKLAEISMTP